MAIVKQYIKRCKSLRLWITIWQYNDGYHGFTVHNTYQSARFSFKDIVNIDNKAYRTSNGDGWKSEWDDLRSFNWRNNFVVMRDILKWTEK